MVIGDNWYIIDRDSMETHILSSNNEYIIISLQNAFIAQLPTMSIAN